MCPPRLRSTPSLTLAPAVSAKICRTQQPIRPLTVRVFPPFHLPAARFPFVVVRTRFGVVDVTQCSPPRHQSVVTALRDRPASCFPDTRGIIRGNMMASVLVIGLNTAD